MRSDIEEVSNILKASGSEHIDLGQMHWKLLVDVESLLMFCRSALDIFAKLTRCIYLQMDGKPLPKSFSDQVTNCEKHKAVDSNYFTYISGMGWYDKLKQFRDDLAHKTSLKVTIEPVANRTFPIYLATDRGTLIRFEDIDEIVTGFKDFASFYVSHFAQLLNDYEPT
ncbi:MAG: hypothetical protein GY845_09900 [Planctomycetes bacterium]|nr:hypothetical protein [Planctomycetota bacterium]